MTIFVDASALVAMVALEPEFELLAEALDRHDKKLTSAVACWEAATGIRRSRETDILVARDELQLFIEARAITIVAIGAVEGEIALDAYARYGKGIDPAGLNMGDCFAYACAKAHQATLLYKGKDFARTDLA